MEHLIEEYISTRIVLSSLIGVHGEAPHAWGNYCSVAGKTGSYVDGIRILNMWAENISAAKHKFNLGDKMLALTCSKEMYKSEVCKWAAVIDPRIPKEWRYDRLCFTGGYTPPVEALKEIYEYLGDPEGEFEQFTDPFTYYAKRGKKYDEKTGMISWSTTEPSRPLGVSWESRQTITIGNPSFE